MLFLLSLMQRNGLIPSVVNPAEFGLWRLFLSFCCQHEEAGMEEYRNWGTLGALDSKGAL